MKWKLGVCRRVYIGVPSFSETTASPKVVEVNVGSLTPYTLHIVNQCRTWGQELMGIISEGIIKGYLLGRRGVGCREVHRVLVGSVSWVRHN